MYYCMHNDSIRMYLNNLLSNSFITSLITYHMLSMEIKFMISLEIFMWRQITIAHYEEYVNATGRMEHF